MKLVIYSITEQGCQEMVKLKGENQIEKFRLVAERLASKISSYDGVMGIVFIGGLVRGFTDKFSDLDITVFLDRKEERLRRRIYDIGLYEKKRLGIDIDLEVHFLEDFKRWKWDEAERWEFSRAKIVFDPKEEIKKMFSQKLRLPKDFWIKRVVVWGEYVKWYCCPPRENVGTVAEAWIERGNLAAAHYCINYAADLLLKMLFALNKEFLPAPKWRIFYSSSLKWRPAGYKELIEEAMIVKSFSLKDVRRRLRALRKLWCDIVPKIEDETGLTTDQLSRYFVEQILHQTCFPSGR